MTSKSKPEKDLAPAGSADVLTERSPDQPIVEELRRLYAEADERRRERERQFVKDMEYVQRYRLTGHGFSPKGKRRLFDAVADMRELEQEISDAAAWREKLLTSREFQIVIDVMPETERMAKALNLVEFLRFGYAIFHTTPLSRAVNPEDIRNDLEAQAKVVSLLIPEDSALRERAKALCNLPTVAFLLEFAALLVLNSDARVLREIADRYHSSEDRLGLGFNPENLGRRGAAASSIQGAWRGWMVKELAERMPQNLKDRDAAIAGLLQFASVAVTRQNVRSILLKGHT
jgi:hypothetical protein